MQQSEITENFPGSWCSGSIHASDFSNLREVVSSILAGPLVFFVPVEGERKVQGQQCINRESPSFLQHCMHGGHYIV